ncbi:MAG TPA: flagellar hook-length control protein FliK, partial [Baekduia sp.]|nr:flagellar hook-length control protein FliK [Baekduia sp.]
VGPDAAAAAPEGAADGESAAAEGAAHPDGTPGGKLQIPAELLAAKGDPQPEHGQDFRHGHRQHGDLPPAPTLPPAADAATVPAPGATAAANPVADASANAPAPVPGAIQAAQPGATPQTAVPVAPGPAGGPALTRGSVVQTAERVEELVRIATTRAGNARATLQLRPESLGRVDVQLRTTRDGLVATIAAHDQVGLDALHQAGAELRRALEDKGVQLHSLDLQLGAGAGGSFANQGDARQASPGRGASSTYDLDDEVVAEAELLTLTPASSTAAGALVDVQA